MSPLDPLFRPASVAVLGVSRNPAKLGHRLLKNVLDYGYPGAIFPVNPSGESILGLPTVANLGDLPPEIDLALVSLPGAEVLPAVRGLAARRVRVAVILSSGFGEVDAQGQSHQAELKALAERAELRLVGPNCMGVFSNPGRLNGTYFWDLPRMAGGLSVVSQSGAYGGLIMRHLGTQGLGLSKFLSIGNQVDLEIADLLDYFADDPETSLIAAFIESVGNGRRFVEAARHATALKPVVVLKGGRSEAGRRAAGSHTGALAGTFEVYQAAFRRAGVVACRETEEFFDAIQCLARQPILPKSRGVAIITVSGGPSVIAADTAEAVGLAVPPLSPPVRERLRGLLPSFAAFGNPVDLTPQVDPAAIAEAARLVLGREEIAGAVAINVGLDLPEFADGLAQAARSAGKPLVACAVDVPGVAEKFRDAAVPVYPTPERAVRAYRALTLRAGTGRAGDSPAWRPPRLPRPLQHLLETGKGPLPYHRARQLLRAYGVLFCREGQAVSAREALEVARRLAYPVVVKALRAGLLHKTEIGGVRTDIRTPGELREACRAMPRHLGPGPFLIQQQIGPGVELLIGGKRDPTFGPILVCGSGGILAEALGDVSVRLAPVHPDEAREMLREGIKARLLQGVRGRPPCDPAPLVRILLAVGHLLADQSRIVELDLNPVIALRDKALAVDALVILRQSGDRGAARAAGAPALSRRPRLLGPPRRPASPGTPR